ncbi:MAG: leucine-rich repeat domain-containing protein [Promethearchaeota archaeon]
MGKCSLLKRIVITNCNLEDVPPELGQLPNLWELNLSNNHLKSLPDELETLGSNLLNNKFSTLEIRLDFNLLSSIPACLARIPRLMNLSIRNNNLTTIPDDLENFPYLKFLDLFENNLKDLPDIISHWPNLWEIRLDKNPFEQVPSAIFKMPSIKRIFFYHCNIRSFPKNIELCPDIFKHFRELHLEYNPIKKIPKKIAPITFKGIPEPIDDEEDYDEEDYDEDYEEK